MVITQEIYDALVKTVATDENFAGGHETEHPQVYELLTNNPSMILALSPNANEVLRESAEDNAFLIEHGFEATLCLKAMKTFERDCDYYTGRLTKQ